MRVIVTVNVEAGGPEEAADAFTPLLADLGMPVAERWEPVPYDRAPGTYMVSAVLAGAGGDADDAAGGGGDAPEGAAGQAARNAREIAVRLAARARLTGWQVDGDADDAEAVWNGDAQGGGAVPYPGVTWALIEVDPAARARGDGARDEADDVFADRALEGEAFLLTLLITMDEQWWSSTATAVVAVNVLADDPVAARDLALAEVAPLRAAVHEEPRRLDGGGWRVVFKAFAPAAEEGSARTPTAIETARRFAWLLRPSGWTFGGRDCGYAVWGRGDVVTGPVREIFIAVP